MASIAGKGHDSWSKRPGPWMALQSAASEAVLAPGALVCLAASGLVDESLAASEAALQVAVACWLGLSLVTSLVRSYTPVPLRLLNHVAWVVIPTVAAAAAWGRPAVLPIGIYIFARTAFVMLGSMFRSSPTLEMLESARKVGGAMPPAGVPVLPRARILLASDAVPPKVRAASRAAPGRPAPAIPRPRPAHRGSSSRPRPLGRAPGRERGCFRPRATVPLAPLIFFPARRSKAGFPPQRRLVRGRAAPRAIPSRFPPATGTALPPRPWRHARHGRRLLPRHHSACCLSGDCCCATAPATSPAGAALLPGPGALAGGGSRPPGPARWSGAACAGLARARPGSAAAPLLLSLAAANRHLPPHGTAPRCRPLTRCCRPARPGPAQPDPVPPLCRPRHLRFVRSSTAWRSSRSTPAASSRPRATPSTCSPPCPARSASRGAR